MSKLGIGTGITPDDGNGDSLLVGAVKVNSNFNEIYSYFGDGTNLTSGSWQKVTSGINTTSNVGIGTTNPRFKLEVGAVGASGTTLYVNGDARITGIVTIGTSSITLNGSTNRITVGSGVTIDGSTGIISATSVVLGGTTITGAGVKVTGITSTQDLIVYGNGNESGSISTVALMSRNNYIDFGPAIENTSAVQQFALRLGSDRAPGTFGVYNILGASWTNPSGSVFLNNWNGTAAIGINDTAVSVTARPLTVGTGTSTGTASQTLQVTGGAYVSGAVGIGTTNPVDGYNLTLGAPNTGIRTTSLKVYGYADINGLTVKGNSRDYNDNVIITQNPSATFYGNRNVAIGDQSFTTPGAAGENVAIGYYALNVVGNNDGLNTYNGNTAVGAWAGQNSTTTLKNTFIGNYSGRYITTGGENTILGGFDGNQNGLDIRTSSNNVVLSDGVGNIRLYANSSGNVGLGTTNPTVKLEVNGSARVGIDTSAGVILTSSNGTKYQLFVENDGTLKTVAV